MNVKYKVALVLTLSSVALHAQKTYHIDEVTVFGNYQRRIQEKVATGSKISRIDSLILDQSKTQSMSELLDRYSVVHIKSLGQGALSTASFRGTATNHTQVLWQGVALNSASLGSFDFSQIPLFFTDEVTLFHGSAAQQSGSGALGGSVNFTSQSKPTTSPQFQVLAEYGANDTYTGGLGWRQTLGKVTFSTRGYYQESQNDYRFLNTVYSKDPFYERRASADYEQAGVMQEVYYRPNERDLLSAVLWWQYDRRSLPQSTLAIAKAKEETQSNNYRTVVTYQMPRGKHDLSFTVANLWGTLDYDRYFGTMNDHTDNDNYSFQAKADYRYNWNRYVSLGGSLATRYDQVSTKTYEDGMVSRQTSSLRGFTLFKPHRRFHFDVDGTLELIDDDAYGIYNTSAKWFALDSWLTLKASHAYNYRYPTLNDLFWNPGGNPDLKSESGFSYDAGFEMKPSIGNWNFELEALYYHMDISNWIMWVPQENSSIWTPVNFSEVRSQGLEVTGKISVDWGISRHTFGGNYTYALSVDNSNRGDDAMGKQLPYIPRNKWNAYYSLELWGNTRLQYHLGFTDVRFTTADESYYTNAFLIHNVDLEHRFRFAKKHRASIALKIDNLLDTYYESTQYYPMPLRSFRLQFRYYLGSYS